MVYLLQQQRQELDELVGRQHLHVRLFEGVQVRLFSLQMQQQLLSSSKKIKRKLG